MPSYRGIEFAKNIVSSLKTWIFVIVRKNMKVHYLKKRKPLFGVETIYRKFIDIAQREKHYYLDEICQNLGYSRVHNLQKFGKL